MWLVLFYRKKYKIKIHWMREGWWNERKMIWAWTKFWLRRMEETHHRQKTFEEPVETEREKGSGWICWLLIRCFSAPLHSFCWFHEHRSGPFKCFSWASWHNVKLCQWRAPERQCRRKVFVPGSGTIPQWAPVCTTIWLLPLVQLLQSLAHAVQWPTVFSSFPSKTHPPRTAFPGTLEGRFPSGSDCMALQWLLCHSVSQGRVLSSKVRTSDWERSILPGKLYLES